MAKQKLYDWGDGKGKVHSIPLATHVTNMQGKQGAPLPPPPGSYDPTLDAQQGQANRGLSDLIADTDPTTGTQSIRNFDDYQLGLGGIATQRTRGDEDYGTAVANTNTQYGRSLDDLLKARTQGGEDYGTSLTNLSRQYQQLGDVQLQQNNKAGAAFGSGAELQAAQKRAANQAIDKAPIDTAYNRFLADSQTSQGRLTDDQKTDLAALGLQHTRQGQDLDTQTGQLGLTYQRQGEDLSTTLSRAKRENTEFGLDTATQRQYQAQTPVMFGPPPPAPQKGLPAPAQPGSTPISQALTAAPGLPGVKKKKKGNTITYTASVGGP